MKALDLTNKRFGKLIAIERAPKRQDKYTRWICQCDCGIKTEVRTDYLTSNHTTSCGCEKQLHFSQDDLMNQRFGKLIVIQNIDGGKKLCKCDCGNTCTVMTYNLKNGNTLSCGCLKSKGEEKINQILNKYRISFKTQYEESLKHIQKYDKYKTEYCKLKHIPLIRIPYTEYDNISIDYILSKIEELQG